jgi:hypothetical protein
MYDGLYYTSDAGMSWEFVNQDRDLGEGSLKGVTGDDLYFDGYDLTASGDYGRTFIPLREGLPHGTKLYLYNPDENLFAHTGDSIYRFVGDRWHLLRGPEGEALHSPRKLGDLVSFGAWDQFDFTLHDGSSYLIVPYHGILRAETHSIVSAGEAPVAPPPALPGFTFHPNPATNDARVILQSIPRGSGELTVFDILGRQRWKATVNAGVREYRWNLTDFSGHLVQAGTYLIVVQIDGKISSRLCIVRRP